MTTDKDTEGRNGSGHVTGYVEHPTPSRNGERARRQLKKGD